MPRETRQNKTPHGQKCLILGAGGHGRVVLDILMNAGGYDVAGFVDSNPDLTGRRIDGVEVLGQPADLLDIREELNVSHCVVAIGDNGARQTLAEFAVESGYELINAIHPSANLASNATLGHNVVAAAGVLVCAHCRISDSVILNTGCIVDHESRIGAATHICPGARLAGRVTVDSGAFVGIGATIIQNVRVGYEAVVGAGAVVINDVPPMATVVGVPARPIQYGSRPAAAWKPPEARRDRRGSVESTPSEQDARDVPRTKAKDRLIPEPAHAAQGSRFPEHHPLV